MSVVLRYGPRIHAFAYRPLDQDAKISLLYGSIRAGKSFAMYPKIWRACDYPVGGWRVITGVSKQTIYNNVLNDLFEMVGANNYSYNHQSGLLRLFGSKWIVIGAKDEGSEKFVRGMTAGVAICDEVTTMPQQFFQMLLTRLSPAGSRLYGTTNTDSPLHWLKKDYLDRERTPQEKGGLSGIVWSMRCTMDDNPNLTEDYKRTQKLLYRGLFYQRFIEGLWVLAEGGIYRDAWRDDLIFTDAQRPPTLFNPGGYVDRWISVDYGTDHPQVYGEFYDDGETVWLSREWFYDSREQMRQLTDAQYADELIKFMDPKRACQIIIPPDALSFVLECQGRGLWVTDADNAVKDGINSVCSIMVKRKLRIHESCKHTLSEITTYAWDEKAAKRGIEQPVMVGDAAVCMLRYGIHGKIPRWRIAA